MPLDDTSTGPHPLDRRTWLRVAVAGVAAGTGRAAGGQEAGSEPRADRGRPTRFQIACMTLPYARFPLQRALTGIRGAGYRYVAWGTTHEEDGGKVPVLAHDAPTGRAKELGNRCRDLGLEPLM